ncbi:MAG: tetratricopeptide repeat protein [Candidatus Thiodiazotropha sp. (ex Codakia rugifera)]|nr:tetratricopeptide repeat protein [Candidatus Thiodiazotropha sp. (ex Codakia rugifera)]
MKEFLSALPIWLFSLVAIVALLVLLERIYISKKPLLFADKIFGPVPPDDDIKVINNSNTPMEYQPFLLSQKTNLEIVDNISTYAASWEGILLSMNAGDFFALHSWYNECQRHDLALLCLDITISRGMSTSKNYSFRSASLRKLGKLKEARASANYALELDSNNNDAHYNLAIIKNEMGLTNEIDHHLEVVLKSNGDIYKERLRKALPDKLNKIV